jgi:hypothetical protein
MRDLLLQLYAVLTTDTGLTAVIPSNNIGASVRQNAGSPCLEYEIDGEEADHSGHRTILLDFVISSQTGAEECYAIKDALEKVVTAKKLSTPLTPLVGPVVPLTFSVMQSRLTDTRANPRSDWAHSISSVFTLRVADKRPQTQKQ